MLEARNITDVIEFIKTYLTSPHSMVYSKGSDRYSAILNTIRSIWIQSIAGLNFCLYS